MTRDTGIGHDADRHNINTYLRELLRDLEDIHRHHSAVEESALRIDAWRPAVCRGASRASSCNR